MGVLKKLPVELILWVSAISWLALINPYESHFSFCLFSLLGFDWCPGCGIGHSMSMLLHGNLAASFDKHSFGLVGLLIISHRIHKLIFNQVQQLLIVHKVKTSKIHQ
jgi:hypothetical protein